MSMVNQSSPNCAVELINKHIGDKAMRKIAKGTFVSIDTKGIVNYHYHVSKDISFSCNLLSEVGQKWQQIYRDWFQAKGYKLEMVDYGDVKPYIGEKVVAI